jgi:enoyl-CoA hydratase/carnithine racemase
MLLAFYIIARAMSNAETTYSVAERVATITLNRPDKLNAWTAVMEQDVASRHGRSGRTTKVSA